jgi:hypothetical protein
LNWSEDVDTGTSSSGNESTEEGKTDKASRSNGESLSDGGSGVTSGIKGISLVSNFTWESTHLSNTTGIVRDWAISVDSESNWEGSKHTEGRKTDSVHAGLAEAVANGGSDAEDWDNAGVVSEGETLDDVWGWSLFALFGKILGGSISVAGEVLGGETNEHT